MCDERLYGCLSSIDIKREVINNEIQILPFRKENLTDLGYNLTPSDFIFSTGKKILLEVMTTNSEKYVMVPPNDTVLVLSKEYVSISKRIMGTFHSRVRTVSQGFGHVSTTLDPGWKGSLLFAVSNTSSKKKKFVLQSDGGKGLKDVGFVTVIFQYLATELAQIEHDNRAFRVDILGQYYNTSSYMKRTYNKSFRILNDIIESTREMSPEKPIQDVSTEVNERLQDFLRDALHKYEQSEDNQGLLSDMKCLNYGFQDVIHNASYVFATQIQQVRENAARAEEEASQENMERLYFSVQVLIGGCRVENKNIRWKYYTDALEKKIAGYRISKRMRLIMFVRKRWIVYATCAVLGILVSVLLWYLLSHTFATEGEMTVEKLILSEIPMILGQLLGFILGQNTA
ncbi:dCTP deaminase domain-containing protein [Ruminococcus gauvreauii]|uniref:Uncharacterized protein n=1 Tax=Ruminococcus gauvreauii TaxID=438033 RepID=A0ABY5VGN6_9FIRM|nr:hypothetical protein [Ruminococcus gauvreauii]UWP59060.1 hypothetical protein NQ502_17090 [Ruminococcus gauvreauii]